MPSLFDPLTIGDLIVPNRIFMVCAQRCSTAAALKVIPTTRASDLGSSKRRQCHLNFIDEAPTPILPRFKGGNERVPGAG
jgi:hypothetical protein